LRYQSDSTIFRLREPMMLQFHSLLPHYNSNMQGIFRHRPSLRVGFSHPPIMAHDGRSKNEG